MDARRGGRPFAGHLACTLASYGPPGLVLDRALLARWRGRTTVCLGAAVLVWLAAPGLAFLDLPPDALAVGAALLVLLGWVGFLTVRLGQGGRLTRLPRMDPDAYVEAVLSLVEQIPPGRVTTYGTLAEAVGYGGPRRVGRVMSTYGGSVPWWRVVRADGSLPPSHDEEARAHYLDEGTPLRSAGRMDMAQAFFGDFRP